MGKKDAKEVKKKAKAKAKAKVKTKAIQSKKNNNITNASFKRFTLGGAMLFLFMLLYIPSLLNWLSGNNISRDIVRIGTIEEAINSNGIIIRDEELLKPPMIGGKYIAVVGEGEKTAAFSQIATVTNTTSNKLMEDIEEVNAKIIKARMEKAEKTDFFSEDLAKLDNEIGKQVQNIIMACNALSFQEISRYRNDIGKIVEKKAEIVGENSTDNYISTLIHQKTAIQEKLNRNTVQVISDISGVVSYEIDGYEAVLKPDTIHDLTPQQLDKILEGCSKKEVADGNVIAGKTLAKIIKGTDIYIAANIREEEAKYFKTGDKISLRIYDIDLETEGVIVNVNIPVDGKVVIVVKTSRGVDMLSAKRIVNIDFLIKIKEGLKVPIRCLRDFSPDGSRAKIMLVKKKVTVLRPVEILCRDGEYAIIGTPEKERTETVNLYDEYIINPDNIKEGEIIEK